MAPVQEEMEEEAKDTLLPGREEDIKRFSGMLSFLFHDFIQMFLEDQKQALEDPK